MWTSFFAGARTRRPGDEEVGSNRPKTVRNALRAKNKFVFIDGTLSKPQIPPGEESSLEAQAWERCNSMMISWLFYVIAPSLHPSVTYVEDAKVMWDDLKERFSVGHAPRIHQLKNEIASLKQGGMTIIAYYSKLKGIWDELNSYSRVPECTCGAAKEFIRERDEERIHQFLMGLNDDIFGTIRSQILSTDPLPTLGRIHSMITQEERHGTVARGREDRRENMAFAIQSSPRASQVESERPTCKYRGKVGHEATNCNELFDYPANWNSRGQSHGKRQGMEGRGQNNGAHGDNAGRHTGAPAVAAAHVAAAHESDAATAARGQGVAASVSEISSFTTKQIQRLLSLIEPSKPSSENLSDKKTVWILDTGASCHMTGDLKLLSDVCELAPATVRFPAGVHRPF